MHILGDDIMKGFKILQVVIFFVGMSIAFSHSAIAAPLFDIPLTVEQPDGTTLEAYVSGDEFFNYLHDSEGRIIKQHPETGFWVYAALDENDLLIASNRVALNDGYYYYYQRWLRGRIPISSQGITTADIDFSVNSHLIREFEDLGHRDPEHFLFDVDVEDSPTVGVVRSVPIEGHIENIVIMIAFAPEDPDNISSYEDPIITQEFYDLIEYRFNSSDHSLGRYIETASGGMVTIDSTLVGPDDSETSIIYQDIHYRSYFIPYHPVTNPNGYCTEFMAENAIHGCTPDRSGEDWYRGGQLLVRAIEAIDGSGLLEGKTLDTQRPGFVDSVTFIVRGNPEAVRSVLWPHMGSIYSYLNGVQVNSYHLLLEGEAPMYWPMSKDTIIHEQLHVFTFPDLYRYYAVIDVDSGPPVGLWDIMSVSADPYFAFPNTHTKQRYAGWGDPPLEITESGTFTLSPLGTSNTTTAYAIPINNVTGEFILIEYRNAINGTGFDYFTGTDQYAPGLLVSRINPQFRGNSHSIYPTFEDEVYIFRPNAIERNTAEGDIGDAALSANVGRTSFGSQNGTGYTNTIYRHDGVNTGIEIYDVTTAGDTISFSISLNMLPVTFDLNGGDIEGYTDDIILNVKQRNVIGINNVPNLTHPDTGYKFFGWQENGIGPILTTEQVGEMVVNEPLTFRAVWTQITDWELLREHITNLPEGSHTVRISQNLAADVLDGTIGTAIEIPAGVYVTLEGRNSTMNVLTQTNSNQRHFIVDFYASLILGNNITLSGGAIDNTNNSGGVGNNGTLTMLEGSIIENCHRIEDGGAIKVSGGGVTIGVVNINGGIIRNNSATYGGGISLDHNSYMTMDAGLIENNNATAQYFGGGGIFQREGVVTIEGGNIIDNTATNQGGGVYVATDTDNAFTMTGGMISGNTAVDGGGIFTGLYTYESPLPTGMHYTNIYIGADVNFTDNIAINGAFLPPTNAATATNIAVTATRSGGFDHALNNLDINFRGGEEIGLEYTVRFLCSDRENYEVWEAISIPQGAELTGEDIPIDPPSRDGYHFVGWSLTAGGEIVVLVGQAITESTDFYAIWEEESIITLMSLTPSEVTIDDENLEAEVVVEGDATGDIELDTADLPEGVTAIVDNDIITITGQRPEAGQPDIVGDFQIIVNREGATETLIVNVNLTALTDQLTLVLTPNEVAINNDNLGAVSVVSGTATGEIELDTAHLPDGVMATVEDDIIIVTGQHPETGQVNSVGSFEIIVTREGVSEILMVNVELIPLPPQPQPSLWIYPQEVLIDDNNLMEEVLVGGISSDAIELDTTDLPEGVMATLDGNVITVTGERPSVDQADINGEFEVTVTRQGLTRVLIVNVNLTALFATPTLILTPAEVTINDENLEVEVLVGGTAGGIIELDTNVLPDGVMAVIDNGVITVMGQRPVAGEEDIVGDFEIVVTRQGLIEVLAVDVNLTALTIPSTLTLTPPAVTINDENLMAEAIVGGTASGIIGLDTSGLPDGVTATVANGVIGITGRRPEAGQQAIEGVFTVVVQRQQLTEVLIVNVNLTPLPSISTLILNPNTLNINDANLAATSSVGGTASGDIELGSADLPDRVTAIVVNDVITVIGRRPEVGQADIVGEFEITVTREGLVEILTVNVNLTAQIETTAPTVTTAPTGTTAPTETTAPAVTTAPTGTTASTGTTAPNDPTASTGTTVSTGTTDPSGTTSSTRATAPTGTIVLTGTTAPTETAITGETAPSIGTIDPTQPSSNSVASTQLSIDTAASTHPPTATTASIHPTTASAVPATTPSRPDQPGIPEQPIVSDLPVASGRPSLPQTGAVVGLSVLGGTVLLAIGLAITVKKKKDN